ncbi:hypothetical protein BGZ61DRAFT_444991 [Ilyonectria robusta]|uniref:uncharacterized protein n=1 Tax=Ilyonectria robusta TaxID=1079257 RepID=UPI001E8E48E1|nr:uncharacterized protein BGZ61DRAFT_444991 [Ilyonectria robusta]KAH8733634.1 hypothetical protein BGZ61DRAFT_444991 [Ilyonectria robusta]
MSRFFPHTPYAEDQPLSRTILTTHVVARTITASALISAGITTTRQLVPAFRPKATDLSLAPRLLRSASTGTLVAVGLGAAMTAGRMQGREEIEWQDRSWRLLENKGQVETDDWSVAGMAAGAAVGAAAGGLGWRGAVGGMGLGSVGGMLGYLGWRYGVNGGEFPEVKL